MKTQLKKLFAIALLGLFTVAANALTLVQEYPSLETQPDVKVAGFFDNFEKWEENCENIDCYDV